MKFVVSVKKKRKKKEAQKKNCNCSKKKVAHQNCTVDKQCNTLCEQCVNTIVA